MKFIQDWGAIIAVFLAIIAGVSKFSTLEQKVSENGLLEAKSNAIKAIKNQEKVSLDNFISGSNTLPIGTVFAYWGTLSSIKSMNNYELCDGSKVTTEGSKIIGKYKPNLVGRFPRGADSGIKDVSFKPKSGGKDEIPAMDTGSTILNVSQLPVHSHTVIDPGHSHDVHNITNAGNIYDKGGSRQAASYFSAPNNRTSNNKTSISISNTGTNKGHNHSISEQDNRPAFLNIYYIIKVK